MSWKLAGKGYLEQVTLRQREPYKPPAESRHSVFALAGGVMGATWICPRHIRVAGRANLQT